MVSSAPYAGRFAGDRPGRRRRRAPLPADQGAGQARRLLRRPLPDHRFHAVQLRELRLPPHLHRHPVQVALAVAAHPHGLEGVRGRARRVHRDPAAAEARRRALVPRHRRRRLPEPLLDHAREPASTSSCCPATTSTRWTTRGCCASIRSAAPRRRSPASRCRWPKRRASASSPSTPSDTRHRLPGEAARPESACPARRTSRWSRWASTSSRPTRSTRRSRPMPRATPTTTSARTSCRR